MSNNLKFTQTSDDLQELYIDNNKKTFPNTLDNYEESHGIFIINSTTTNPCLTTVATANYYIVCKIKSDIGVIQ